MTYKTRLVDRIGMRNLFILDSGLLLSSVSTCLNYPVNKRRTHIILYTFLRLYIHRSLCCRNLKLPSRRPSLVCENCLYSLQRDMRARAFHILEPKGTVDMLIIFLEERSEGSPPLLDSAGVSKLRYAKFLCVCTYCK